MEHLKDIAARFAVGGDVTAITPLGDGLINDTYLVSTSSGGPGYVLQRINHHVFADIEGMQRNIEAVTAHIRRHLVDAGEEEIDRKVLEFIPLAGGGATCLKDGDEYWRMSRYIRESVTLADVTPATARCAGQAFGHFQLMLADLDRRLTETIPGFHDMELRLRQLHDAVGADAAGRVGEAADMLEEIERRAHGMCHPERLYRAGRLPKRICHCDTKVSNMLFDRSGAVLCVIDLDTVMPSFVFSDYGDFLRTAACTAPEDEADTSRIDFDMDIFTAFTEGYLSEARAFLTDEELAWLPDSVALFPYMQAVRFLTDYINGDTYYKIAYPEHNLVRARAQLRLLQRVEERMTQLRAVVGGLSSREPDALAES